MMLLSAARALLGRTGRGARIDKAAQEEALRLCLASNAASRRAPAARRGRGGGTADPGHLLRELGFEPPRHRDSDWLAELLGFAPRN